nr:unnamed protein product [Callosobruchus analis]
MEVYNTCLRRGIKWYRILAIEVLTGAALVNAYVLQQEVTNDKMTITKLKELITKKLLNLESLTEKVNEENKSDTQYILEDIRRPV